MLVVGRDKGALDCRLQPVKILHESPLIINIIIINHKSDEKYTTYKPLHATNFQTKPRVLKNQAGKKYWGKDYTVKLVWGKIPPTCYMVTQMTIYMYF